MVLALCVVLTILFSSPDEKPSTVQSWSRTDPVDFVTTATTELDGSSVTGLYGPPYNHASDGQHIGPIHLAKWLGVSHPVDTAQDFVLAPLRAITGQPTLAERSEHLRGRSRQAAGGVDDRATRAGSARQG